MDNRAVIWLLIFAISAALFFVVAGVVTVKGLTDLRTLLRHRKPSDEKDRDISR